MASVRRPTAEELAKAIPVGLGDAEWTTSEEEEDDEEFDDDEEEDKIAPLPEGSAPATRCHSPPISTKTRPMPVVRR